MQDSLLELVEMLERSTSLLSTLLLVIRLRVESRVSIEGWKNRRKLRFIFAHINYSKMDIHLFL